MIDLNVGDSVKFTGCTIEQINWGSNDDPTNVLNVGNQYIIEQVEIHSQHTKIKLKNINGKYNSVCFEKC